MKLAERLKELRAEKNMSLKQLELLVGIDDSRLSRWENGQLQEIADDLIKLANFYAVSSDYLLGLENYDYSKKSTPKK